MARFLLSRFLWSILVILTVATLTFGIMRLVPGGPFDEERPLPPEIKANIEAKYHLDEPFLKQYFLYLGGLIRGDLGPSYKYVGRTVNDIIWDTLPVSVELGLWAVVFSLMLGVGAGIVSAVWPRSWADYLTMFIVVTGISIPNFVLGALLIMVFSFTFHIFPPALWEGWRYTVLPAVTLSLLPAAYLARLTRSSLLEVIHKDFIRTARAKGLSDSSIILKHALTNAISPVVTFLGPLTATLVTGSFVVEYIFSVPGMGRFFITAVTNRDYPLIMGVTLIYSVLIVFANMMVDVLLTWLDPRIRIEEP